MSDVLLSFVTRELLKWYLIMNQCKCVWWGGHNEPSLAKIWIHLSISWTMFVFPCIGSIHRIPSRPPSWFPCASAGGLKALQCILQLSKCPPADADVRGAMETMMAASWEYDEYYIVASVGLMNERLWVRFPAKSPLRFSQLPAEVSALLLLRGNNPRLLTGHYRFSLFLRSTMQGVPEWMPGTLFR
jgi:hypothetical protein